MAFLYNRISLRPMKFAGSVTIYQSLYIPGSILDYWKEDLFYRPGADVSFLFKILRMPLDAETSNQFVHHETSLSLALAPSTSA